LWLYEQRAVFEIRFISKCSNKDISMFQAEAIGIDIGSLHVEREIHLHHRSM